LLVLDQARRFLVEVDARLLRDRVLGVARDRRRLVGGVARALDANADRRERRGVRIGDVDAGGDDAGGDRPLADEGRVAQRQQRVGVAVVAGRERGLGDGQRVARQGNAAQPQLEAVQRDRLAGDEAAGSAAPSSQTASAAATSRTCD